MDYEEITPSAKGLRIEDVLELTPLTYVTQESILQLCTFSRGSPIAETIRMCARWLVIKISNLSEVSCDEKVMKDIKLILDGLTISIGPLQSLIIDTIVESSTHQPSKLVAADFCKKFERLKGLSDLKERVPAESLTVIETDWVRMCQSLYLFNKHLLELATLKVSSPEVVNVRYPPQIEKSPPHLIIGRWLLENISSLTKGSNERLREYGRQFSAWTDNGQLLIQRNNSSQPGTPQIFGSPNQ